MGVEYWRVFVSGLTDPRISKRSAGSAETQQSKFRYFTAQQRFHCRSLPLTRSARSCKCTSNLPDHCPGNPARPTGLGRHRVLVGGTCLRL